MAKEEGSWWLGRRLADTGIDRMRRRTRAIGGRLRGCRGRCSVLLLVIDLRESAVSDQEIGPHGQRNLVLLACQVKLPGRGEQVAKVHVTDRFAVGSAQERECILGASLGGERQAEVGAYPFVLGREPGGRVRARSASAQPAWR